MPFSRRIRSARFLPYLSLLIGFGTTLPLIAQTTLYWDGDGSGTVGGGAGTWNITDARWSTIEDGTTYQTWDNATSTDDAVFQDTAGTVTLGSDITVRSITFGSAGYNIAGAHTLIFDEGTGSIDTGTGAQTISANIAGDDGLTKSGSAALSLSGNNTYTGTTTVTDSTLRISSDDNLGSGQLILNGGNLLIESDLTVTLDPSRGITTSDSGSKIFVSNGSTATFDGVIDGTGGLAVDNPGLLVLTGANTYSGATNIRNGTLSIDGDASLGTAPGSASVNHLRINGGDFQTTSTFEINANRGISLSDSGGNFIPDANTTLTYAGIIADDSGSDTGNLVMAGTGTLVLSGANSYSGTTHVQSGTLQFANPDALYGDTTSDWTAANLAVDSGATLSFNVDGTGEFDASDVTTLLTNLSTINDNGLQAGARIGFDTTNASGGTFTISDDIADPTGTGSGALTLVKNGSNTLVLSGSNSYTGGTLFNAGRVNVSDQGGLGSLPSSTDNDHLIFDGGELRFTAIGSIHAKRGITINDGGATLSASASNTLTIGSIIAGTGDLEISGSGTVILNKTNTFTGTTSIPNIGTLQLGTINALQYSTLVVPDATDNFNFGSITDATLGGISGSGDLALNNIFLNAVDLTIGNNNADTTYSGVLSGSGSLVKVGTGTTTLSGNNTFTDGTTLSAGTINVGHANAFGTLDLTFDGGGIQTNASRTLSNDIIVNDDFFIFGSNDVTLSGTVALGSSDRIITVDNTASTTLSGVIGGSGKFTKAGTGSLTLSGTNTYIGGTQINEGRLNISEDANLGYLDEETIDPDNLIFDGGELRVTVSGHTLNANRGITLLGNGGTFNQAAGPLTYNGIITGSGGLTKTGTSNLTLGGTNTYTGSTTINQGNLFITEDANLGTAPGTVTVDQLILDGGHLNTSGDFTLATNRGITVGSSGGSIKVTSDTLTYGGTITGNGTFTKSNSGTLAFSGTIDSSGADDVTGGDANDVVLSGGTLSLQTGTTIDLTGGNASSGATPAGNGGDIQITGGTLDWQDGTIDLSKGTVGTTDGVSDGNLSIEGGTLQTTGALLGSSSSFKGNLAFTSGTLHLTDSAESLPSSGTLFDAIAGDLGSRTLEIDNTFSLESDLTLSSASSLSAPAITITSGNTLDLTASNALTGIPAITVNSGASIDLNATANTIGSLAGAGNVSLGSGTLTTGDDDSSTLFSGIISDTSSGNLTKSGSGTLTLSGLNTYTGTTTISEGTLQIGDGGTTGNYGTGSIVNNSTLSFNRSDDLTIADAISGTGLLNKLGANSLTLTSTNTFSGGTTIDGGTLVLGHATDTLLDTGTVNINFGTTLDLGANSDTVGIVNFSRGNITGTGTLTATAFNLFTSAPNTGVVSANLAGSGTALTLTGSGFVELSGTNTYTGGSSLNGGTLGLGSTGALGTTGTISLGGGTLQYSENNQTDYSDRFSTADNQTFDIDTNGQDVTFTTRLNSASGGELIKAGTGTLALSGTNNYDGTTTINGGTLQVLPAASITHTGSDLDIGYADGDVAILQIDTTGSASVDTANIGFQSGSTGTANVTGTLSADDGLIVGVGGNGTLNIESGGIVNSNIISIGSSNSGNNGTGAINVSGTLNDGSSGITSVVGSSGDGSLTINSGGLVNSSVGINLGTFSGSTGTINIGNGAAAGILNTPVLNSGSGNAIVNFNHTSVDHYFTTDGTSSGTAIPINGTTSVTHIGSGKTTLNTTNDYTGGTTISAGTLVLGHATDSLADTGAITINGGTLDLGSNADSVGNITLSSGTITGSGTLSTTSINFTNDAPVSISGTLGGAGSLTVSGTGNTTLTATNSYTGGTTISDGSTLTLGHATDTLADTRAININGGTFALGSNSDSVGAVTLTSGTITGSGTLSPTSLNITIDAALSMPTIIGGSSTLSKSGDGTLTLTGANTYKGLTNIHSGILELSSGGSLSLGSNDLDIGSTSGDNGTLQISAGSSVTNRNTDLGLLTGTEGTVNVSGTWTSNNSLSVGGEGTGNVNVLSGGILNTDDASITGQNTGGIGTAIINGTWNNSTGIIIGHSGIGVVTVENGSISSNTITVGQIHSTANGTANIGNAGTININEGSGTLRLANASSANGTINITGSTSPGILNAAAVDGTENATLNFNHAGTDYHFTNTGATGGTQVAITGSTKVNHTGTGTTTLTGSNTYSGATTISAGELRLSGSTPNSAFTISGGRLSGSGTVGMLTLGNGGILAPGNSPGTLNAGSTTWEGGGAFEWEVNNAAGIVSTNWDLLNITGGLNITATSGNLFTVNLVSLTALDAAGEVPNFDANADASWTFVTATTGITFGAGASIGASFAINSSGFQNTTNGTFGLAQDGNNLNVTYTTSAVPEPASFALLFGLYAIGFTATRRRRT